MNNQRSRRILFITHSAKRTGAPLLLLDLMKWLKANTSFELFTLLAEDGPLRAEFDRISDIQLFLPPVAESGWKTRRVFARWKESQDRAYSRSLLRFYREVQLDLIYSNTITNGSILKFLESIRCPIVTHVHELQFWIAQCGKENLAQVKALTGNYIAASGAVRENLVARNGIPGEAITTIHEFIRAPEDSVTGSAAASIRRNLGIPQDAFVVAGSGAEAWRKGKDLFVQLAMEVRKKDGCNDFHFIWVGAWESPRNLAEIEHDIRILGLSGAVHLTGEVENPLDYFAAADVFAMVSREDPFPLVCLEAALLGKPVLCFEKAGGMPEFVEQDAGYTLPYLDLEAMADKICFLKTHRDVLREMGQAAAKKVRQKYTLDTGAARIRKFLEERIGN